MCRALVLSFALLVVCMIIGDSQGGPSQRKQLEPTVAPKMAAGTALPVEEQSSSSEEDSDSTSEEGDDDDLNVEGKTGKLCAKHPNLAAMESECMAEYESMKKAKCNSTEQTVMEGIKDKVTEGLQTVKNTTMKAVEKVKEMVGMSEANTTQSSASNTTRKHNHRRRSCHFYQCMLKKMDALDEATKMPNEEKVLKWISQYVTDIEHKKMDDGLQSRINQCFSNLRKNGVILSASDIAANAANTTLESSMPVLVVFARELVSDCRKDGMQCLLQAVDVPCRSRIFSVLHLHVPIRCVRLNKLREDAQDITVGQKYMEVFM